MVSAQVRLALQAMRYYRLWIYASNLVLMAGVLIFTSTGFALLSDPRRQLLPRDVVTPHQPSVVYAYLALFLQGAVLPFIGCLGALRLSERLLHSYWVLLLLLLVGDVIVGLVWAFRFQRLVAGLVPDLKQRLSFDYGTGEHPEFDAAWDLLQRSARCCGVESPADYNNSAWLANLADRPAWQPPLLSASGRVVRPSVRQQQQEQHSKNVRPLVTDQRVSRLPLPDSCCRSASLSLDQLRASGFLTAVAADVPPGRKEVYGTGKHRQQLRDYNERYNERMMREQLHRQREQAKLLQDNVTGPILSRYPRRAATISLTTTTAAPPVSRASRRHQHQHHHQEIPAQVAEEDEDEDAESEGMSGEEDDEECGGVWPSVSDQSDVHEAGCGEFVLNWLQRTGDTLFVLGYCVLAFLKLCFLGILRYELREMVQKIKILQTEQALAASGHPMPSNGPFHCGILSAITGPTPAVAPPQRSSVPPALVATEAPTESEYTTGDIQQVNSPSTALLMVANGEVPSGGDGSSGGLKPNVQRQSSFSQYSLMEPLSPPDTPVHRLVQQLQDTGADSDSGSHCALLPSSVPVQRRVIKDWDQPNLEPTTVSSTGETSSSNGWPGSRNGNNNEYHELREIKQTQI